jgi:DNA-binding transcriptional ArsR family regulator
MPNDKNIVNYVSKMHVLAKGTIDHLDRENKVLRRELLQKEQELESLQLKVDQIYEIFNIETSDKGDPLVQELKDQNAALKKKIDKLQQEPSELLSLEDTPIIDLFKHPFIREKIKQVDRLVSYAEEHIWSIITCLIQNEELSLDQLTLFNKIAKSSTSSIISKMRKLHLIKMRKRGRTPVYSLDIEYLKNLIKTHEKKKRIQTLSNKIRGGDNIES